MKILVHVCCAPCAVYPFRVLQSRFDTVIGLWYNPNIHPYTEYCKRLEAVRQWSEVEGVRLIYEDDYDLRGFLRQVAFREERRCFLCYHMRLQKAAVFARKGKFDYFTSTLILSPHQKQRELEDVARSLEQEYGVAPYLERPPGVWAKTRELSQEMGLYRQQYCGCVYSEMERFRHGPCRNSHSSQGRPNQRP